MNSGEQIRRAMHAQPFRQFALRLVDGSSFVVQHPDFIAVPPGRRPRDIALFASSGNGSDEYETHWIDLGLVIAVVAPGDAMPLLAAESPSEDDGT
jgi:hypothetical protein